MRRLAYAAVAAVTVAGLAACGSEGEEAAAGQPPASTSSPSSPAAGRGASGTDLAGTWESQGGELRLVLREDGTFTEAVNGEQGAYEGTYEVTDGGFTLSADSGERAEGTVDDDGSHPHLELSGYTLHPR
jgi:hypothetical protein